MFCGECLFSMFMMTSKNMACISMCVHVSVSVHICGSVYIVCTVRMCTHACLHTAYTIYTHV